MAKKAKGTPAQTDSSASESKPAASEKPAAAAPRKARKARAAREKAKPATKPAKRGSRPSKRKSTSMRKTRRRYSDAKRQSILTAAQKDGLTALEVQKRFGVTPVTYYSWRKKSGAGRRGPGRPKGSVGPGRPRLDGDIASQLRSEVQRRIRELIPTIVSQELEAVLGRSRRR